MTSTLERPGTTLEHGDIPVVSLARPTRRRPSWVVAGVVLVGLAALLGAYVFTATTETIRVTVAAGELTPGEPIGPEDLRVVEMGKAGNFRAILADQQSLILGQTPRSIIPDGTLLNTDLFVVSDQLIPSGMAVVGASLDAGQVPTPSLAVGDRVTLLAVDDTTGGAVTGDDTTGTTVIGTATVWSTVGDATNTSVAGGQWISLLVDSAIQTDVAQATADDRLRLSLVGR